MSLQAGRPIEAIDILKALDFVSYVLRDNLTFKARFAHLQPDILEGVFLGFHACLRAISRSVEVLFLFTIHVLYRLRFLSALNSFIQHFRKHHIRDWNTVWPLLPFIQLLQLLLGWTQIRIEQIKLHEFGLKYALLLLNSVQWLHNHEVFLHCVLVSVDALDS